MVTAFLSSTPLHHLHPPISLPSYKHSHIPRLRPSPIMTPALRACVSVPASATITHKPHLPDIASYQQLYLKSITNPEQFWRDIADQFEWRSPSNPSTNGSDTDHSSSHKNFEQDEPVLSHNFLPGSTPVSISFLPNRLTNISYNAIDRWIDRGYGDRVAFYCEGNEPSSERVVTYSQLSDMVQRFANVLKNDLNTKKGDVVILYMPMIPELPAAMLACARIGALHSVVFGGFSAEALAGRIIDSKANVVVVAESVGRGKKNIALKKISDEALDISAKSGHKVAHQVVVKDPSADSITSGALRDGRDIDWNQALKNADPVCPVEWLPSEHPLFILYTSGSTGKPKGVQHCTGGYMVFTATTFKYSFDYHENDVFFSTSDCGWITGHSYVTYGPLLNGATQVLYEGVPNYPDPSRLWQIVAKYKVNQLYTAPTVIRALKGAKAPASTADNPNPTSDDWVKPYDTSSLRILGTVGEPINPEAWLWYNDIIGGNRCAIVDTWWQTETGGHCITPLPIPGLDVKPGSAMMPFFGIQPAILDGEGTELKGEAEGFLVIKQSWPSALRTIYGDHKRMEDTYFSRFPGYYMTGDGARRDADGHYWLVGRVDDIINVSGHRIGTAEVESAIVLHEAVAEAAVVGVAHNVKGESLYAYVSLMSGMEPDEELRNSIRMCVRKEIGPFASPDVIHWAEALPKTRSGKIMRRILRKIAANGKKTKMEELGDTSTLTDPTVVDSLLHSHGK